MTPERKQSLEDKLFSALTRYGRMHPWVAKLACASILPVVKREIQREIRRSVRSAQKEMKP